MKKMMTAVALLGLSLPVAAQAMEFQTPGTLGIGRAGVARTSDAYATFINPAGLAFYKNAFSMKLGGGVGVAVSSSLADNVDKVGKLDLGNMDMNYTDPTKAAEATAKAVQFVSILDDLKQNKGNLAVNVDLALGFQYRSYGLGIIGTTEIGAGIKDVDNVRIAFGSSSVSGTTGATATTNVNTLVADMYGYNVNTLATQITPADSNRVPLSSQIFTGDQYSQIWKAFQTAGGGATAVPDNVAQALANKLEAQLATSGTSGNATNLTPTQLTSAITTASNMFDPTKSIDNNESTILLSGLALAEVPLGYGHKFDFGKYGKLGVGGAVKVMQGSVYYKVQNIKQLQDSSDAVSKAKDQHKESTQVGVDLGALWRLEDVKYIGPINVGLALKNLNSPKFDGPKDLASGETASVKVEPQARLGLGLDPFSWLSIVADMDLTKNKTVIEGRDSQLIGGGLEAHFDHWYALWLALRAGAYQNIGQDGSKPVITAGLSLGPQYFRFDLNGAVATAKGKYDNKSVPLEAKVEFGLSTAFF